LVLGEEGEITFSLTFSIDDQCRTWIAGSASTRVNLVCQTCLGEFSEEISCEINTVIVDELNELFDLDQDHSAFVASGKYVSLQDILEDELMVAIPMAPKHRTGCVQEGSRFAGSLDSEEELSIALYKNTYRPFSDLALKFKGLDRKEV
tara:strand:- start:179 stop:625 length:447 start_codon:yes stop_codon:yes gene_type:complete